MLGGGEDFHDSFHKSCLPYITTKIIQQIAICAIYQL